MHIVLWPLHFKPVIGKAFMLTVAKCNSAWVLEHTVHRHKQSQEISLEETGCYKKRTSRDSHSVKVLWLLLPLSPFLLSPLPCIRSCHVTQLWDNEGRGEPGHCLGRPQRHQETPWSWMVGAAILAWMAPRFSMSCSGVDDPRRTELTPSFLRHQAGKREHRVRKAKYFWLVMSLQTPSAGSSVSTKTC